MNKREEKEEGGKEGGREGGREGKWRERYLTIDEEVALGKERAVDGLLANQTRRLIVTKGVEIA